MEASATPAALSKTIILQDQAGQPVRQGMETGGALRKMLKNIDRSGEFISIAVYPDSYAEFNYIKGLAVARGIDYMWAPMEPGEALAIVTSDSVTAL